MENVLRKKCINCGILLVTLRKKSLEGNEFEKIREIIARQIHPAPVMESDFVCLECWSLLHRHIEEGDHNIQCTSSGEIVERMILGHREVCVLCGKSILREPRSFLLNKNTELAAHIYFLVTERINPRPINPSARVCLRCYLRCQRAVVKDNPSVALNKPSSKQNRHITLEMEPEVIVKKEVSSEDPLQNMIVEIKTEIKKEFPIENPELDCVRKKKVCRLYMDDDQTLDVPLELSVCNDLETESYKDTTKENLDEIKKRDVCKENLNDLDISTGKPPNDALCLNGQLKTKIETILLPNYRRVPVLPRRCIFKNCKKKASLMIPLQVRRKVFVNINIYMARGCRICENHLKNPSWHLLKENGNLRNDFSARNIECMLHFLKYTRRINFEECEFINDRLFNYLLGIKKEEFELILHNEPRICEMHRGRTALAACMIKAYTGNTNERIALLLQIKGTILKRLMAKASKVLQDKSILKRRKMTNHNFQKTKIVIKRNKK